MVDAITRTLARLYVTRRNLLEWMTAAQAKATHGLGLVASTARWRAASPSPRVSAVLVLVLKTNAASSPRRSSCCGCCRRSSPGWSAAPARVGRGPAPAADRRPPPDRPPDLAVLRDVRRSGGPRAAARQLPGRSRPRCRPSHVADQHRPVPAGDRDRARLRLDRHARDGRAPRGDPRHDRGPQRFAGTSTTGTTRGTCTRSSPRTSPRSTAATSPGTCSRSQRLPPDDRPAAARRGRARGDSATRSP